MREQALYHKLKKIIAGDVHQIARDLVAVEALLVEGLKKYMPSELATEASRVFRSGGKRLRPLLVLITARIGSFKREDLIKAAAAVEIIHTASLIHDDIIDRSDLRRGEATTRNLKGELFAKVLGDYLFALSFSLASEIGSMKLIEILADASEELSLGELDGQLFRRNPEMTIDDYLRLISRKTASLFKASCEVGAVISEAEEKEVEALAEFGYLIGMGFQIFDDILDVTGSREVVGKPVASDLKEGILTLPYLLALDDHKLSQKIKMGIKGELSDEEILQLAKEIIDAGYVDEARNIGIDFLNQASESLQIINNNQVADSLLSIARYVASRYY